jgi:hypothetical protein
MLSTLLTSIRVIASCSGWAKVRRAPSSARTSRPANYDGASLRQQLSTRLESEVPISTRDERDLWLSVAHRPILSGAGGLSDADPSDN